MSNFSMPSACLAAGKNLLDSRSGYVYHPHDMRNFNVSIGSLIFVIGVMVPSSLPAATIYTTVLGGGNEVPPTGSPATGTAVVTLNGNTLSVSELFSGLTAPGAAAHIHCCAPVGVNAPVAVPFTGFPAATSGTYNQSFDLTLAATYNAPFLALFASVPAAETALIAGLNGGQTYANIHNANFPGGEIRGQLQAIPEPSTVALMLLGLAPVIAAARKRRTR